MLAPKAGETPALRWVYGPLRGRQAGTGLLILSPSDARRKGIVGRGDVRGERINEPKTTGTAPRQAAVRREFCPSPSIWGLPVYAMGKGEGEGHLLSATGL